MAKFDIARYAETLERPAPAEPIRDIETITCEVLSLKQKLARNIVDIGLRLMEAKAMLPHGAWLPWLEETVHFSEKSAQNYIRVAREFPNPQLVADLGVRKALALLELPPAEREAFAEENNVIDMTSRELEKAIRERDEARRTAETAQADARSAEESRTKMEEDMRALKEMYQSALDEAEQAAEDLLAAQKELEALRNRPVDVAVEVDREAVEKARAEAVAEMQAKVDAAEKARKEAEDRRKDAEKALAKAKKTAGANAAILSRAEKAEAELAEARRQLEGDALSNKRLDDGEKANWALLDRTVAQTRDFMNQIAGIKLKAHGKGEAKLEEAVRKALLYLSNYARSCAE